MSDPPDRLSPPLPVTLGKCVLIARPAARLCAGFPSPADDHLEDALDPARLLVVNEAATFMMRVEGFSAIDAGITDGDYVIVDRSIQPRGGDMVVAVIDGQLSLKRVVRRGRRLALDFANGAMPQLAVGDFTETEIWGVVTWSMRQHRDLLA